MTTRPKVATFSATYYDGPGGVQMSSFFRRLAYAWQFADVNILISGQITGDSRLQYRRAIQERIHTVAPLPAAGQ